MMGERRASYDAWAIDRLRAGWHPKAVAIAVGISVRTAYRWRKAAGVETIGIGGWSATFIIRDGQHPVRVSDWQRDEPIERDRVAGMFDVPAHLLGPEPER